MVSKPKLFQEHKMHKKHKKPVQPVQPEAKQRRLWGTEKKRDRIWRHFCEFHKDISWNCEFPLNLPCKKNSLTLDGFLWRFAIFHFDPSTSPNVLPRAFPYLRYSTPTPCQLTFLRHWNKSNKIVYKLLWGLSQRLPRPKRCGVKEHCCDEVFFASKTFGDGVKSFFCQKVWCERLVSING